MSPYSRRRVLDAGLRLFCGAAVLLVLLALFSVLACVFVRGVSALGAEPSKVASDVWQAIGPALAESAELVAVACALGAPLGILAGVHLAEHELRRSSRFVRMAADCLGGVPTVLVGLCVYEATRLRAGRASAWAGCISLAVLLLPSVARTTRELLVSVPDSVREAALGLGVSRLRTTWYVLLPAAARAIAVGVMLAVSRVAGEAAPLLFAASAAPFGGARSSSEPVLWLPVSIYRDAISGNQVRHERAWLSALVLLTGLLLLNWLGRSLARPRPRSS